VESIPETMWDADPRRHRLLDVEARRAVVRYPEVIWPTVNRELGDPRRALLMWASCHVRRARHQALVLLASEEHRRVRVRDAPAVSLREELRRRGWRTDP
jgi:hypothetical protein